MGVISGIDGAVNGVSAILDWQVDLKNELQAFVDSGTARATGRLAGNDDWSGSYNAHGYLPASLPGEALSFLGSIDGTNGASGTAIVDQVAITFDIEGKKPISHTVNFSANGALTLGAAVAADTSISTGYSSADCKIELCTPAAEPTWAELTNLKTITLTLTAANLTYVDSSTGGLVMRKAGPLDWSLSFAQNVDDFADLVVPGTLKGVRIYGTAALYWELLWGRFADTTGLKVDRATHAIVSGTQNVAMCGATLIGSTATRGHILKPDASHTQWWPPAA